MKLRDRINKKEEQRKSVVSIYDPVKEVDKSIKLNTDSYESYLEDLDKYKLEREVDYDEFYEVIKNNISDDKDKIRTKWNEISKNMLEPTINSSALSKANSSDGDYSKNFVYPYSSSSPIDFNFGIPSFNIYDLPPNVKLLDFRPAFDWRCYRGSMSRQIFPGIPCRFEIIWCSRDFCWHTPYWRRWRLRWRRHCISVRYPCGVRISTMGRVGLVNASFPRKRIYHFPGLSMRCDSEISASGDVTCQLSSTIDVNGLMSALGIYDPRLKAQVEGKKVEIQSVVSSGSLPQAEPEPEPEAQPEAAPEPEPEPEASGETISFADFINGPISTIEDYMTTNHKKWEFNFDFDTPYYGHVTGQNLSSPTTDDAFVVWAYTNLDSKKNTGTISFVAYADGEVTVVYGCTYAGESVQLIKSNQVIDETTEVKKSFTFDVKQHNEIKIQEKGSVIALYSITLTPSSTSSSIIKPESVSRGYGLNRTNYNSSDVHFNFRNTKFGDYLKFNSNGSFETRDTMKHQFTTEKLLKYNFPITNYEYIVIGSAHGKYLTFMGNGVITHTSTGGKGYTTDMLMTVQSQQNGFFTLQSVSTGEYLSWNSNTTISAVSSSPRTIKRGNTYVDSTQWRTYGGVPPIRYKTQWYYGNRANPNDNRGNSIENEDDEARIQSLNESNNTAYRWGWWWWRHRRRWRTRRVRVYGLLDRMAGKAALMFYDENNASKQRVMGSRTDGTNFWRSGIYSYEMFNIVGLSGIKKQDDEGYQGDNVFKLTNNGSDMHYLQHNQTGLYMTSTGSTKNKSEAELFEIVEEGDSNTFNIKTQNNKYLTFEGQSIKTRDTNNGFGTYSINQIYTTDASSSIANSIDLSSPGKIFDRIFDNGFSMQEFMALGNWIMNNSGGEVQFSITSWTVTFGFQLKSFGVYWGSQSLFGAQNIGDSETIELLGGDRTIDLDLNTSGIQLTFNFGTYSIGELASAGAVAINPKSSLAKLVLKCAQNELNKSNLSSGRKNTMNTVVSVLRLAIDSQMQPVPGLDMILSSSTQEISFAAQFAIGSPMGAFLVASTYISIGDLKKMLKTFIVETVLGPIKFMVKYARINVGWLWNHMPGGVRNSINWLNRHIDWANRVFLQYLTQGVMLALRGIDNIPLPNVGTEVTIKAPVFGASKDIIEVDGMAV